MCGSSKKIKETPEEKTLAKISSERWESYKARYIPVENMMINRTVGKLGKEDPRISGMANTSTQMQFSGLEPKVTSGLTLRGAGPGSGAFTGAVTGLVRDRTKSSTSGQINSNILGTAQNINNLQNIVRLGQGHASGALTGLSQAANAASRQAILDAQAAAAARAAVGQAIGTAAGLTYGAYNTNQTPAPQSSGLTYSPPTNGTYSQPGVPLVATGSNTLPGY
jgi:hypothetical protein